MHLSGKEFRKNLGREKWPIRCVPAFSKRSLQPRTQVYPPPKCNPFKKQPPISTLFKRYFIRGDIPLAMEKEPATRPPKSNVPQLRWLFDPNHLDYCYYLPLFIEGIVEKDLKYRNLAEKAAMELIMRKPNKILPVIPQLILPIRRAFDTRDCRIIIIALTLLQKMVLLGPCVGQALVPYYRQLLPICNLYRNVNINSSKIDRHKRIGDVVADTLEIFERCGGPDAYVNIKYLIPTYESCVNN